MVSGRPSSIVNSLRKCLDAEGAGDRTDAELLALFAARRDEAAFAAIMRRHGRMILRLCQRTLRHTEDAEDVFQATFLVLARMAGSIRKREALGSWLYGVAYRLAQRSRAATARRRNIERNVPEMPSRGQPLDIDLRDLQAILDEEVARLPDKYRDAFVSCCLEGKSRTEAAQALGWKEGTLASRLAHARLVLQERLSRRGVTLSAALGATALAQGETLASVPPALAASTLVAVVQFVAGKATVAASCQAVALATGMLQTLMFARLRFLALVLLGFMLLSAGAGFAAVRTLQPADDDQAVARPADVPADGKGHDSDAAVAQAAQIQARTDRYGEALPDGVIRRFGTVRLRQCGAVTFTHDGRFIVSGGGANGSDVVFWDRRTGKETRRIPAKGSILRLQFSPDGAVLAAMTGAVITNPVWDSESGKVLFTFQGEHGSFTSDGRLLLGVRNGDDGPIVGRWDAANGKPAGAWTLPADVRSPRCSPDGKTVAFIQGNAVVLYDLEARAERRRWPEPMMQSLAFSSDGRHLAAWKLRTLRVWNVVSGQEEFAWNQLVDGAVVFSADSKRLAWTGYDERSIPYPWVVDIGRDQPRRLGLPINNLPSQMAFSPDGATLAVHSDARALELRDTATGRDVLPLDANTGRIFRLELSPDGRHLATFDNFRVLVWEQATGKLLRRFPDDAEPATADRPPAVWDVRLTGDGGLSRGNGNQTAGHWEEIGPPAHEKLDKLGLKDGANGRPFATFPGTVMDVLESPSRRYLAVRMSGQAPGVGDSRARIALRVWDALTRRPLDHVQPPDGELLGAFSADDRLLATTGADGGIHVWDLATGQKRRSLHGHLGGAVRSILFAPDHRCLYSGGDDSQVLQWDLTGRAGDGVWCTVEHAPAMQRALWEKLTAADAALAHAAVWALAADPAGTVAFLRDRVKPRSGRDDKEVTDAIAQLDSDSFARRQEATALLTAIGEPAVPAIERALAKPASLEQARRLEKLLHELAPSAPRGEQLRALRALEILERMATAPARALLGDLAQGHAGLRFTQAAKESLQRLSAAPPTQ
jgi:RNA polymerase sigma factor (sigma-70 family)